MPEGMPTHAPHTAMCVAPPPVVCGRSDPLLTSHVPSRVETAWAGTRSDDRSLRRKPRNPYSRGGSLPIEQHDPGLTRIGSTSQAEGDPKSRTLQPLLRSREFRGAPADG